MDLRRQASLGARSGRAGRIGGRRLPGVRRGSRCGGARGGARSDRRERADRADRGTGSAARAGPRPDRRAVLSGDVVDRRADRGICARSSGTSNASWSRGRRSSVDGPRAVDRPSGGDHDIGDGAARCGFPHPAGGPAAPRDASLHPRAPEAAMAQFQVSAHPSPTTPKDPQTLLLSHDQRPPSSSSSDRARRFTKTPS